MDQQPSATNTASSFSAGPTPHARVDNVMDHWLEYDMFSDFLRALLSANDMTPAKVADLVYPSSQGESRRLKFTTLNYLNDKSSPTYHYIETLLASNALGLDPDRIGPGGDQRIKLFAAAGLIEVTPESIAHFNEEVCASIKQEKSTAPHYWHEAVSRLVLFHTQGDRLSYDKILASIRQSHPNMVDDSFDRRKLQGILCGNTPCPHAFRTCLYKFLELTPGQQQHLNNMPIKEKVSLRRNGPAYKLHKTAHEVIEGYSHQEPPPSTQELFLNLLKASDVRFNYLFQPTEPLDTASLTAPAAELQTLLFNRKPQTTMRHVNNCLDFIDSVLNARSHATLSSKDREIVLTIANRNLQQEATPHQCAISWKQRLTRLLGNEEEAKAHIQSVSPSR